MVQRLRTLAFGGAVLAGVGGLLAARRLPGSTSAWLFATGLAGACSVVLFGAVAVVTHATRVPRPAATAIGVALVGWQLARRVHRLRRRPR